MIKKAYMKPEQRVVTLQHQSHLLISSPGNLSTTGLDDNSLNYSDDGGDQQDAW